MSAPELISEINRFREKLLDLSNRNPLLNYRKSKRRTLQIIDELPDQVFSHLVLNNRKLRFLPLPEPTLPIDDSLDRSIGVHEAEEHVPTELPFKPSQIEDREDRHSDDRLQTNLSEKKLESVLKSIRRDSTVAIEETGVNYLFLVLGFLAWKESDDSERDYLSPLVLIPVEIDRYFDGRSNRYEYAVTWREEEIQDNLCLAKRLEKDFGMRLPSYENEQMPEQYFEMVQKAVSHKPTWNVRREALLGFFSFQKLLMYIDIDPENWKGSGRISPDSVAGKLIWGQETEVASRLYAPDYEIDKVPSSGKIALAVDADSSQHSALVDIAGGRNLVIEGPPGTGKSQTITNAITAAIHEGKTVLFVAEKLAALEVVHSKMAKLGLADFCLELHSDAASPRRVYESLKKRLDASFSHPARLEMIRDELERKKSLIAQYLESCSKPAGPYNEPLYELLWRVVSLRSQGYSTLRNAKCDMCVSLSELEDRTQMLDVFSDTMLEIDQPRQSPWWGFWPDRLNPNDCQPIGDLITSLREILSRAKQASIEIDALFQDKCSEWIEKHVDDDDLVVEILSLMEDAKKVSRSSDTSRFLSAKTRQSAAVLSDQLSTIRELRSTLGPHVMACIDAAAENAPQLRTIIERDLTRLTPDSTWRKVVQLRPHLQLVSEIAEHTLNDWSWWSSNGSPRDYVVASDPTDSQLATFERLRPLASDIQETAARIENEFGRDSLSWAAAAKTNEHVRRMGEWVAISRTLPRTSGIGRFYIEPVRLKAQELVDILTEARRTVPAIKLQLFTDLRQASSSASELHSIINQHLFPVMPESTWGRWLQIKSSLQSLIEVFRTVQPIVQLLESQGLGPLRTLREFEHSEFLCKLIRHPIVLERGDVPAPLFYRSASDLLSRGQKLSERLIEQRAVLEECFDFEAIPSRDELRGLTKELRVQSTSWLRILSRTYRRMRRRVAEFQRMSGSKTIADRIQRLEELEDWLKSCDAFSDTQEFKDSLGTEFRGFETNWEQCKTLHQWVLVAQSRGLDHAAATRLLERRNNSELTSKQVVHARHLLATELTSSSLIQVLGLANHSPSEVPLALLQERAEFLNEVLGRAHTAGSAFSVDAKAQMVEVVQKCEQVMRAAHLVEKIDQRDLWTDLGDWYAADESDATALSTAIKWGMQAASLGLPQATFDTLVHNDIAAKGAALHELTCKLQRLRADWCDGRDTDAHVAEWIEQLREPLNNAIGAAQAFSFSGQESFEQLVNQCNRVIQAAELLSSIRESTSWKDLGDWYQGEETDVEAIRLASKFAADLSSLKLPSSIIAAVFDNTENLQSLGLLVERIRKTKEDWLTVRKSLTEFGSADASWLCWTACGETQLQVEQVLAAMLQRLDQLPMWSAFCRSLDRCKAEKLQDFTSAVLESKIEPRKVSTCYRFTVLEQNAESAVGADDRLRLFSRNAIDRARERFQCLDRELLQVNRMLVAYEASQMPVPSGNSRGKVGEFTELGLIRHEIQKQRRFCRIRDLLHRAGEAVQSLKPCFMMSPLSVAQFLDPRGVEFDLVIMDEASQVKPEDAIGTVLRAKQFVVVGDPKQLPPTSFFDRISEDVDDADATQFDNTESILEVAMKSFQPVRRLRWHYRSEHESLIHFSNDRFYDGDLVVFPSAKGSNNLGLRYHYIENGKFENGCNLPEAEAVARAIVSHAMNSPDETLGVGTFNLKQSILIEELLDKFCVDAATRAAVEKLRSHPLENLFINNLETLQGHERDVILISYTYGRDPTSGRVLNRFGPITGAMGWRRINVLVTRARRRVEVFSSMVSAEIQGGPSKSLGVNAFKDYLEYCRDGVLPDRGLASGRDMESPFEEAVARVITRFGLEVVPQVGVAGYFIDLGVRKPGTDEFLLGIECDGATYHSARSARDRDRLREEVVRSRGWQLHRIWSTDWYLNQKHEEDRLMKALAQCSPT